MLSVKEICWTSVFKAKCFKAYVVLALPEVLNQTFKSQTHNQSTKT